MSYPNRIGVAKFDRLEVICFEIYDDDGYFSHHQYTAERKGFYYDSLLDYLDQRYPTVSRLLFALGEDAFLGSVLSWDASCNTTRNAFYNYLASQVFDWEDQPR